MLEVTREIIVEAAKRATEQVGETLTRSEFERISRISHYDLYRAFPKGG